MKYFIIAGEASGDMLGAKLIAALKQQDPQAVFHVWGGDKMKAEGATVLKHIQSLAFFGFWQVIINIRAILRNIAKCKKQINSMQPDIVIGIDYPGFNLKMLGWAKKNGYPTIQYVLPQVWAWNEKRIKKVKKNCDHVLVILPFEKKYCQDRELPATFIGHPITEYIQQFHQNKPKPTDTTKKIVIFPGSRKNEVSLFLPIILKASQHFPDEQFVIVKFPTVLNKYYEKHVEHLKNVSLSEEDGLYNLHQAKVAIVKSGTSTLETALMKVPEIMVYKFNFIGMLFIGMFAKFTTKFFALPNIILEKEIFKELIQFNFTSKQIIQELDKLLHDKNYTELMKEDFDKLEKILHFDKPPSTIAAKTIIDIAKSHHS